jgi:hypothetical protein
MLSYHAKSTAALKRLRADMDGVVSFEYVIVAACIVAMVGSAFNATAAMTIGQMLSTAASAISTAVTAAV